MPATDNTSIAFFRAINETSGEIRSAVAEETRKYRQQQLDSARETADRMYDEYIASALTKMAGEDGIEAEQLSMSLKKKVLSVRQNITDSVFHDVTEKLQAFVQTEEYGRMLILSAEKMADICKDQQLVIFINSRDMKYADSIKSISDTMTVEADDKIILGGIYGVCKKLRIKLNDLLENRLDAQKAQFCEYSGLTLQH